MNAEVYRRDIDGLRAVAVLAVVGFHAFPNFIRGGFVGVDIFFVISGYLITGILFRQSDKSTLNIAAFYARRIRRIFPALIVVALSSLLFGWYVLLAEEFKELGKHLASASLFASNFVLWQEAGYFDAAADSKPLLHLWSLAIEEQFYLAFPLLLLLLRRWRTSAWWLLLALAMASFTANLIGVGDDATGTFYSPFTRAWELLAGGVLASLQRDRNHDGSSAVGSGSRLVTCTRSTATLAGGALIAIGILGFDRSMAFPGWRALLPTAGTLLLIAAGPSAWVNHWLLSRRALVAIGLISYPLYLWHWPVLRYYVISRGELVTVVERLALIAVAFVFAWLTYRFVEAPIRWQSRTRVLQALLATLLTLGGLGAASALGGIPPRHHASGLERIVSATTDWQFPPPHFRTLLFEGYRFFTQRSALRGTVLFIGDSNVQQYAPRLNALLSTEPTNYLSVVFATRGGCLPIPNYSDAPRGCEAHLSSALRYAQSDAVERVVIGGYWLNIPPGKARDDAVQSIGRLIASLSKTKKVYLLMNIPAGPAFDPRNMFTGSRLSTILPKESPTALSVTEFLKDYGALREALASTVIANGATPIDPLTWLCADGTCPVLSQDGRPLYMDEHHMRPFHAAQSAGFVDVAVKASAPAPLANSGMKP